MGDRPREGRAFWEEARLVPEACDIGEASPDACGRGDASAALEPIFASSSCWSMSRGGSPPRSRLPQGDSCPLLALALLSPLVEPMVSLAPGRIDRRLAGPLDIDEPWLEGLAEPFMVPAIDGRGTFLLVVDGGGGGAIDMRLPDVGGTIDLRVEGVFIREGVEEAGEAMGSGRFVGDLLEFYATLVRRQGIRRMCGATHSQPGDSCRWSGAALVDAPSFCTSRVHNRSSLRSRARRANRPPLGGRSIGFPIDAGSRLWCWLVYYTRNIRPDEHAMASGAVKVSLTLDGSIILPDRLIENNADPISRGELGVANKLDAGNLAVR